MRSQRRDLPITVFKERGGQRNSLHLPSPNKAEDFVVPSRWELPVPNTREPSGLGGPPAIRK